MKILDCTLRDGGYYNDWDFDQKLVVDYLEAMDSLGVDYVEIGFRSLKNSGFKGAYAYSDDEWLSKLVIPRGLKDKIGVMVNGAELVSDGDINDILSKMFSSAEKSPVSLVRVACHVNEFAECLPAATWLKEQGYQVGFNLMQVADCDTQEITRLASIASEYPLDVLYFADSLGSLNTRKTVSIVRALKEGWFGDIGIHTHDNMGRAISNSIAAFDEGVEWLDCTVAGMGRGPGNAQTEYLYLALDDQDGRASDITKLLALIDKHFRPLQQKYRWGSNPYYYLAGKYGIHPSYVQEMMMDERYSNEDLLAALANLKKEGGKKFTANMLESARRISESHAGGSWQPRLEIKGRKVLIIGAGPSVRRHKVAIEGYIRKERPVVIGLNTHSGIDNALIDYRAACHPVRIMADMKAYEKLSQPLVAPVSKFKLEISTGEKAYDFGVTVEAGRFAFYDDSCVVPTPLVSAYALAISTSGGASSIELVGFDGYAADDSRQAEMADVLRTYAESTGALPISSLTKTSYDIDTYSIYGMSAK